MVNIKQYGMRQSASFSSAKSVQQSSGQHLASFGPVLSVDKLTVNAVAEEEVEGSAVAAVVHFAELLQ